MDNEKKVIFSKTIEIGPEGAEVSLDGNDGKSIKLRVKVTPKQSILTEFNTEEFGLKAKIGALFGFVISLAIISTYKREDWIVEACLVGGWLPALWWSLRWSWMKWRMRRKHGK